jgi:hypothetical protein
MALAIVATAIGFLAQAVGSTYAQHKAARLQAVAQLEAGNLLEQLMSRPWDALSSEKKNWEELAVTALAETLPRGQARVLIDLEGGELPAKRITVVIETLDSPGRPRTVLAQLVAWKYRDLERSP